MRWMDGSWMDGVGWMDGMDAIFAMISQLRIETATTRESGSFEY
jgi:hypothetical protein